MTSLTGRLAFHPFLGNSCGSSERMEDRRLASTYGVKDAEAGKHLPGRSCITRSSAILERRSRSDEELMTMALEVSEAKNMTCRGHL